MNSKSSLHYLKKLVWVYLSVRSSPIPKTALGLHCLKVTNLRALLLLTTVRWRQERSSGRIIQPRRLTQDRTQPSRVKGLRLTVLVMAQSVHVTLYNCSIFSSMQRTNEQHRNVLRVLEGTWTVSRLMKMLNWLNRSNESITKDLPIRSCALWQSLRTLPSWYGR